MLFHLLDTVKPFIAQTALKWLLLLVAIHVVSQITFEYERSITQVAFVRFVTLVNSHMGVNVRFVLNNFVAENRLILLFFNKILVFRESTYFHHGTSF